MTKIYLVRHCEAEGNKTKIFQGHTDCEISETGAKQLEFLANRFKDVHIDKIYSSPLKRAYLTALAVAKDKNLEVNVNEAFIEMYGGVVEGATFLYIYENFPELKYYWSEEPHNFAPKDGESMRALYDRAKNAIEKVAADPDNKDKTLLIATHGGLLRCLMCGLMFGDIEKLISVPWSANTAVTLLSCDENGIKIEYANDDSHVPEEYLPAANRIVSKF